MRSGTQMLQDVEPFITCFSSLLRLKRGNSYRASLAEHPQSASVQSSTNQGRQRLVRIHHRFGKGTSC